MATSDLGDQLYKESQEEHKCLQERRSNVLQSSDITENGRGNRILTHKDGTVLNCRNVYRNSVLGEASQLVRPVQQKTTGNLRGTAPQTKKEQQIQWMQETS